MMNQNRRLRIGVKYCGGCNPTYDRVALVERMGRALEEEAEFVSYAQENLDLVLVVCGCETACVDVDAFKPVPVRVVSSVPNGDAFVAGVVRERL
jgi:fructose-1-phosphate kinase PfkB-like protein